MKYIILILTILNLSKVASAKPSVDIEKLKEDRPNLQGHSGFACANPTQDVNGIDSSRALEASSFEMVFEEFQRKCCDYVSGAYSLFSVTDGHFDTEKFNSQGETDSSGGELYCEIGRLGSTIPGLEENLGDPIKDGPIALRQALKQ